MASSIAIFAAGVLTVLSPCVLPVAPILVGGLVASGGSSRWGRLRATLWFVAGFAFVFMLLGLGVSALVTVVQPLRGLLLAVAAAACGLFGLKMLGLVDTGGRFAWMERSVGIPAGRADGVGALRAVTLGAIFGSTWTPCAGPILGGVLTYVAGDQASVLRGALMLGAYASGVGAPLVLVAAASEYATPVLRRIGAHARTLERVAGAGLVALALLVLYQVPSGGDAPPRDPTPAVPEQSGIERLLFFHSEHCPTCRAMEAYLPALERACRSERWTLTMIDVDRPENASFVERFGVRAVPTTSLLDERGEETLHLVGYQAEARLREVLEGRVRVACAAPDAGIRSGPGAAAGRACAVGTGAPETCG